VTVDVDAPDPASQGLDEAVILLVSMDATNPSMLRLGEAKAAEGFVSKVVWIFQELRCLISSLCPL
jgi:hypothetical protein